MFDRAKFVIGDLPTNTSLRLVVGYGLVQHEAYVWIFHDFTEQCLGVSGGQKGGQATFQYHLSLSGHLKSSLSPFPLSLSNML